MQFGCSFFAQQRVLPIYCPLYEFSKEPSSYIPRPFKNTCLALGKPEDSVRGMISPSALLGRFGKAVSQFLHHRIANAQSILRTGGEPLRINQERISNVFQMKHGSWCKLEMAHSSHTTPYTIHHTNISVKMAFLVANQLTSGALDVSIAA